MNGMVRLSQLAQDSYLIMKSADGQNLFKWSLRRNFIPK